MIQGYPYDLGNLHIPGKSTKKVDDDLGVPPILDILGNHDNHFEDDAPCCVTICTWN